jgi:amino acid transporter/nucleotide-binding universal stress UspA family protein
VTDGPIDNDADADAAEGSSVETGLARSMGLMHVVMIGVGAMIGAGIFVLTGMAAGVAGPALILVFLLNGVVTTLTALSYAELGSCFPEAGGGYLWVKQALPQPNGFLAGWMSWFAHAVACSLYAVAFGAFATKILSLVPAWHAVEGNQFATKVIAVLVTLAFAYINYRGAEETGQVETIVTAVKVLIIGAFTLTGLWTVFFHRPDWQASFSSVDQFMPQGIPGIAVAMGLTFIAFEGYEIIAQCGEEVRDPKRNIPRSIFISIAVVVPVYMLVGFVALAGVTIPADYTGTAQTNWAYMGELKELAMIHAAEEFMQFGGFLFLIGGLFSTMSALNATIYSSSRVSFAMGRDHNLPAWFAKIHPLRKTPHLATAISAVLIIVMAVALPIEEVASAADAMFLLLFVMVNIALINLRRNRPELDRGFKVPLVPFLPLVAIASNLVLAGFLFWHYKVGVGVTAVYILLGIVIYLVYARHKEAEAKDVPTVYEEAEAVTQVDYRILTPVANPKSIPGLMKLARILAAYKKAELAILSVLKVPPQLPLSAATDELHESKALLRKAERAARPTAPKPKGKQQKPDDADATPPETLPVTTLIKISHSVPLAISDAVQDKDIDLMVLGWRGRVKRRNYFFGDVLDATVFNAECDVAMLARPSAEFLEQAKRIVVPLLTDYRTARLSLDVALAFTAHRQVPIVTLHVTPAPEMEHDDIVATLAKQVEDLQPQCDLSQIQQRIIHAKNICGTLLSEIRADDLVVVEAIPESVLNRNFFGEIPERLARELTCSVILTKTYPGHVVSWFQKLFGTRMPEPHATDQETAQPS